MKFIITFFFSIVCFDTAFGQEKIDDAIFSKLGFSEELLKMKSAGMKLPPDKSIKFDLVDLIPYKEYLKDVKPSSYEAKYKNLLREKFSEDQLKEISTLIENPFVSKFFYKITFERNLYDLFHHIHIQSEFQKLSDSSYLLQVYKLIGLDVEEKKLKEMIAEAILRIRYIFVYYLNEKKEFRLDRDILDFNKKHLKQIQLMYLSKKFSSFAKTSYLEILRKCEKHPILLKFIRTTTEYHFNHFFQHFMDYQALNKKVD